jgi:hypothetical protein
MTSLSNVLREAFQISNLKLSTVCLRVITRGIRPLSIGPRPGRFLVTDL